MSLAQLPPSKHWAALKYRGEKFAEVWFKPDGDPHAITFRIPQASFAIPDLAAQLTLANLLAAVAVTPDDIATWQIDDVIHTAQPELMRPLVCPAPELTYLE